MALVILTAVLTAAGAAYNAAMDAAYRSAATVRVAAALPGIRVEILEGLFAGTTEGRGEWGPEMGYAWTSEVLERAPSGMGRYADDDEFAPANPLILELVRITLTIAPRRDDPTILRTYGYEELIWSRQGVDGF